jgi:peptide-methionine (S)-S-oxide reductase
MGRAIFAAGCFWGVEAAFRRVQGVGNVLSGYTGGRLERPSYEDVCSGRTGHAEAVLVEYDPALVSYETLLETFFAIHDPTQLNRQGPDVGTQYRSAIFVGSPEQERAALAMKERLQATARPGRPIVTQIVPAGTFWPAEEYHQNYHARRGWLGCR